MSFISNDNIDILWEVIIDENIIQTNNAFEMTQTKQYFTKELLNFYEREKHSSQDLISMNKNFISQICQTFTNTNFNKKRENKTQISLQPAVSTVSEITINNYAVPKNNVAPNKNMLLDNDIFTHQELQKQKRTIFDNNFALKQKEFSNAMLVPIPQAPKFSDDIVDKPINEMEKLISQTIAERNYDIEKIHRNNNIEEGNKWIKSDNTNFIPLSDSLNKSQNILNFSDENKFKPLSQVLQLQTPQIQDVILQPIKHIKIGDEIETHIQKIDLTPTPLQPSLAYDNSLLSKLKRKSNTISFPESTSKPDTNYHNNTLFIELENLKKKVDELNNKQETMREQITMINEKLYEYTSTLTPSFAEQKQQQQNVDSIIEESISEI
jgi:hypothetical protein